MEILFEDASILVCVKPVGVLSQADAKANMVSLLSEHTGDKVYPVHRLDRETGGVMVYAKTPDAAAELSRQIATHRFEKEYLVLTHSHPDQNEGTWEDLLFKDSTKNKSYVVARPRKGVKQARLAYRLLTTVQKNGEALSLFSVRLFTGRTHQIRVQFSHRGLPLAGDRKYGACDDFHQIGLWSHRLAFCHPESGELCSFTAPPKNIIQRYYQA